MSCFRHLPQTKSPFQRPSESFAHLISRSQESCVVHAVGCSCGCAVGVCHNSHPLLSLDLTAGLYLFVMMQQQHHVPFWAGWLPCGPQMIILIPCEAGTIMLLPTVSLFLYHKKMTLIVSSVGACQGLLYHRLESQG